MEGWLTLKHFRAICNGWKCVVLSHASLNLDNFSTYRSDASLIGMCGQPRQYTCTSHCKQYLLGHRLLFPAISVLLPRCFRRHSSVTYGVIIIRISTRRPILGILRSRPSAASMRYCTVFTEPSDLYSKVRVRSRGCRWYHDFCSRNIIYQLFVKGIQEYLQNKINFTEPG